MIEKAPLSSFDIGFVKSLQILEEGNPPLDFPRDLEILTSPDPQRFAPSLPSHQTNTYWGPKPDGMFT